MLPNYNQTFVPLSRRKLTRKKNICTFLEILAYYFNNDIFLQNKLSATHLRLRIFWRGPHMWSRNTATSAMTHNEFKLQVT